MRVLLILMFIPSLLFARKLDFNEHPFAFEFGGSYSFINNISHLPYYDTISNNKNTYSINGQFSLLFIFNNQFTFKAGIDGLYLPKLDSILIDNLYTATSLYYTYVPNVAFEMIFFKNTSSRAFFGAKFMYAYFRGSSTVNLDDEALNYTLKIKDKTFGYAPFIAYEFSFVDKYSIILKASYKVLNFNNLNAKSDVSNSDIDFTNEAINFSGPTINITLRLYI